MKKFIIDQYSKQSVLRQFLGNTLTGIAWAFWVYLWLPLIAAIVLLIHHNPVDTSAATLSVLALITTLGTHATTVAVMISVFVFWAFLQWAGKNARRLALEKKPVHLIDKSLATKHIDVELARWRQAQSMSVSHDEAGGIIRQIDVLQQVRKVVYINRSTGLSSTHRPVSVCTQGNDRRIVR